MSEDEIVIINKVLSLEQIITDDKVKGLIEEDLQDESWIEATNVLIKTCLKRNNKSKILINHIEMCERFLVFRYIEDKLKTCTKLDFENKDCKWIIKDEKGVFWVNQKFLDAFSKTTWPTILKSIQENKIEITREWLTKNQELFFSNDVFQDVGFLIKREKKKSLLFN